MRRLPPTIPSSTTTGRCAGSRRRRLVAHALDHGVRHRAGQRGTIGIAQSAKPLDRPQERFVHGLAELAPRQVGACAPAADAASLTLGDLRETLARLFAPAD